MLLTEDEAKNKRCQETFSGMGAFTSHGAKVPVPSTSPISGTCAAIDTAPIQCIGSACMAWQWGGPREYEYGKDFEVGHAPADPGWETYETYHVVEGSSVVKFNKWRRLLPGRKGYCGKAGRPQFSR